MPVSTQQSYPGQKELEMLSLFLNYRFASLPAFFPISATIKAVGDMHDVLSSGGKILLRFA